MPLFRIRKDRKSPLKLNITACKCHKKCPSPTQILQECPSFASQCDFPPLPQPCCCHHKQIDDEFRSFEYASPPQASAPPPRERFKHNGDVNWEHLLAKFEPRYHGSACAVEIAVLEKHNPNCDKFEERSEMDDIDNIVGEYNVASRMVFHTCLKKRPSGVKYLAKPVVDDASLRYRPILEEPEPEEIVVKPKPKITVKIAKPESEREENSNLHKKHVEIYEAGDKVIYAKKYEDAFKKEPVQKEPITIIVKEEPVIVAREPVSVLQDPVFVQKRPAVVETDPERKVSFKYVDDYEDFVYDPDIEDPFFVADVPPPIIEEPEEVVVKQKKAPVVASTLSIPLQESDANTILRSNVANRIEDVYGVNKVLEYKRKQRKQKPRIAIHDNRSFVSDEIREYYGHQEIDPAFDNSDEKKGFFAKLFNM